MNQESSKNQFKGSSRLKLYFALSRTPHGLLDMATPAFTALLWLGSFPPAEVIIIGMVTAFCGYTAVYALNDVIDHRVDKQRLQQNGLSDSDNYLDAALIRHPIAQGLISLRASLFWMMGFSLLALIGAYALNPICALIFLAGAVLEVFYCLLWKVSSLRTVVSGVVKTSGGMAGVFAVDPNPSFIFLIILFFWLFFWEIGGQNIPADWTDIEEDGRIQAKTIPVIFGPERSNMIILSLLILAVAMSVIVFLVASGAFEIYYAGACLLLGAYLLILPALRLLRSKDRLDALKLFNRASYYPIALLLVVTPRAVI
jgi:4-hydroxybenzoate polyprenyltransferase